MAGGAVTGVRTSNGQYATDHVICAAGIDSVELLAPVGIRLPLRPMKREVLVTEPIRPLFDPMVVSFVGDAISQTLRGEIVAENAEGEEEMDTRSWSSSLKFTEMGARKLLRLFPCLADVRIARQWAGSYDMSPDHRPILQAFSSPRGLALAAGYSGHGFMLGPMVGKIMAQLVLRGHSEFDVSTFRLERFAGTELSVETTVI
jgi:sarcosine oxidase subunit beta